MYVIAGAAGRVGSTAARQLLSAGRKYRCSCAAGLMPMTGRRKEEAGARLVSLNDRSTLTEALTGCTGFFALLPFDLTVDDRRRARGPFSRIDRGGRSRHRRAACRAALVSGAASSRAPARSAGCTSWKPR